MVGWLMLIKRDRAHGGFTLEAEAIRTAKYRRYASSIEQH